VASPASLDQPLTQSAAPTKSGFDAGHETGVMLVIIPKQVQQAVQGQDAKLGLERVSSRLCLAPSHPRRDHDVAETVTVIRGKRQHIGRPVLLSIHTI